MSVKKLRILILFACLAIVFLVFAKTALSGNITPSQPDFTSNRNGEVPKDLVKVEGADPIGKDACFACHPIEGATKFAPKGEIGLKLEEWDMDVHQKIKGTFECESCHGNGSLHQKANSPEFITNPGRLAKPEQNAVCQSCHQQGAVSIHAGADLSCLECHQFHSVKNPKLLKKLPERELCYQCHAKQRFEFNMYTHHPVNEGIMSCTDCHKSHFSSSMGAIKDAPEIMGQRASMESCGKCHPREAGPYVTSPTALEGCTGCHMPHGATVEKLERMPQPGLCIKCHQPTSLQMGFLPTKCTNCHPNIHGSNHERTLFN